MQILITNTAGTYDVTGLVTILRWSGDYQQAARALDFSIVQSAADDTVPTVDCPVGAAVQFHENGELLFDGFVISRSAGTEGSTLDLCCYDRGFYLKRNKGFYKFTGATPESIVRRIAEDFGLELGEVAVTGVPVTRIFATGNDTLYDILATAYTLAAQSNGKAYRIGFRGAKLCVLEKEPGDTTLILKGGSNMIAANTTESIEKAVTAVQVYDQNDALVRTLEDTERLRQYGRLQEIVKQTASDDKAAAAQKALDDGDVEQKITVDCLGNIANITGGCVVVQEPYTGLYGLFWIDTDTHEWKRGQYYNKLVLNYRRIMDEKEAGSLPNADGNKTGGSGSADVAASATWDYINKPQFG